MTIFRKPGCHIFVPQFASRAGFVFICPGRYEEKFLKPCAGQTGVLLERALSVLFAKMPSVFSHAERDNYLITNAWPIVEYKKKTYRSVPLKSEISHPENIEGLFHEIKNLEYIVACGGLAHVALQLCHESFRLDATVANVTHTSRRALGFPFNVELPARIDEWANSVITQLKNPS